MKKLILILSFVFSCLSLAGEVSLLRANTSVGTVYGMMWQNTEFLIRAEKGSPDQVVQVVLNDGLILEAKFVQDIDEENALWKVEYTFSNRANGQDLFREPRDLNFYVQSLDGRRLDRDDNQGKFYQLSRNDGALLNSNLNIMLGSASFFDQGDSKRFTGVINVRNLAYAKKVHVVFSTDHWRTVQSVDAKFEANYLYGYSCVSSPNVHGIENWVFTVVLPMNVKEVDFALSYQVEGQEYWDNNFGKNYKL